MLAVVTGQTLYMHTHTQGTTPAKPITSPIGRGSSQYYSIVTHGKCIAKYMINPRISAVWSTTKPIEPFSCTPCVQEVHTKAEVAHLTPGLLGLGLLSNCQA